MRLAALLSSIAGLAAAGALPVSTLPQELPFSDKAWASRTRLAVMVGDSFGGWGVMGRFVDAGDVSVLPD